MKKLPEQISNRFAVLKLVYLHGPMTAQQANSRLVNLNLVEVSSAFHAGVQNGHMTRVGYTYFLTAEAKEELSKLEVVRNAYIGEIVPVRDVNVLNRKPWVCNLSLEARRSDAPPPREVSFINGSACYQVTGYRA